MNVLIYVLPLAMKHEYNDPVLKAVMA